jgi:hypothetical protein
MDKFKAPHDKLQCIISSWNGIFTSLRPFGVSGADDYLPIMAYVIVKTQLPSLFSNIK